MRKKKLLTICLLLALAVVFAGCSSVASQPASTPAAAAEQAPEQAPAADLVATPEQTPEQAPEEAPAVVQEAAAAAPAEAEETAAEPASVQENKVLVVCFSATGTTRGVAEKIAALTGAELIDLLPAQPYTTEDLNYNDRTTRATVEQNTPDVRPEIANEISLDGCTTLYLGYPIWWGQAPRIMSTFVESHDFTGITVIPFCTSGSSGAGRTGETLGEQAGTGTFLSSTRFSGSVSEADLQQWIDSRT